MPNKPPRVVANQKPLGVDWTGVAIIGAFAADIAFALMGIIYVVRLIFGGR